MSHKWAHFHCLEGVRLHPPPPPIPPQLQFFVFRIGLYDLELRWHHLSLSLAFLNIRVAKPEAHGGPEASNIGETPVQFGQFRFSICLLVGSCFAIHGALLGSFWSLWDGLGGAFASTLPTKPSHQIPFFVSWNPLGDMEPRGHHLSLSLAFLNIRVVNPEAHVRPRGFKYKWKNLCIFDNFVLLYVVLLGAIFPSKDPIWGHFGRFGTAWGARLHSPIPTKPSLQIQFFVSWYSLGDMKPRWGHLSFNLGFLTSYLVIWKLYWSNLGPIWTHAGANWAILVPFWLGVQIKVRLQPRETHKNMHQHIYIYIYIYIVHIASRLDDHMDTFGFMLAHVGPSWCHFGPGLK